MTQPVQGPRPLPRAEWVEARTRLEYLSVELRRRRVDLDPMYYGAPDLLFPRGFQAGVFDHDAMEVKREPLGYDETQEQYEERQDQAIYDLVTKHLFIVKDDKIISILLIKKMAHILACLFFGRIPKLILWGPRGGGKCLGQGTPVIRADGAVVPVESVRVGDRLMGPDGTARTVQSITQGRSNLYEIQPVKGEPWVCNEDHILTVVKSGTKDAGRVEDVSLKDWVAGSNNFRNTRKQFSVGVDAFEGWDPASLHGIDPHFLGVWFGDGTKTIRPLADGTPVLAGVQITKAGPEVLEVCEKEAERWNAEVKFKLNTSGCPTHSIVTDRGAPNPLLDAMRELLGTSLKIPPAILRGDRKTRLEFLAGFLDTDAELHHNGYVITQKREDWARGIWWIARSLGLMSVIKPVEKRCQNGGGGTYYQVSIFGETDMLPLRIPHKQAAPRQQRKVATRTGFDVVPLGEGDYFGFELDGDGRFLLGDFTVTHNSLLAAIFMWISFVYTKRSCINMGGAGNQARRVYDYTKQFWHNFPGMQGGMLTREPLLQSSEMRNGSTLTCATSVTTAIGEHVGIFVADEASLLPSYQLLTEHGIREIVGVKAGDLVLGREGHYQRTLEQFSHPYDGRILRLVPYGGGLCDWITEEHRVWAIRTDQVPLRRKRKLVHPEDCEGLRPDWVRAHDLVPGDLLCFPRMKKRPGTFELALGDRRLGGPDLWRFFGYWAGGGGAPAGSRGAYPVKLHLSEAKRYFLDDAERLLSRISSGSVSRSQPPSRGSAIDLVAASDELLWAILRHDVGLREERGFPREWLELATDEELRNWLRGYLRTGGNHEVSSTGAISAWCVSTVAEGLALNVLYALNRLGIHCYCTKRPSRRYDVENLDRWDIKIRAAGAVEILDDVDLEGLKLPRAQVPKAWFDDDWCYTLIREIEEDHYVGEVYDLRMDGDPSFGGPAFTMLHNCTNRPGADHDLLRAMQGALSEDNHRIFLLSTFHLPTGFFADVWDQAEDMGFTKMKWNCFDIMEPCKAGLELATEEDPEAIEAFCKAECSLSWERDTYDEFGNVTGTEWVGCLGKARHSEGWQTREQVLEEQQINIGTRVFEVEHACIRPQREGQIYNPKLIDACVVPYFNLRLDRPLVVGIDWGLTQCAIVLVGEWSEGYEGQENYREGVGVIDVVYMSNRLTQAVVDQIRRWQERFGELKHKHTGNPNGVEVKIRADGSHPYCNREVATNGYRVAPVYGDKKLLGEDNMSRWFGSGLFKIVAGFKLFMTQLHNLRRNASTGKQIKKNLEGDDGDHGPDALKFAMMEYDYVKIFHRKKADAAKAQAKKQRDVKPAKKRRGLDGMLM